MRISDWSSVVCSSDLARAEAVQAGEVLVAGRLVDNPLAAQLGLDRLDRDAVRLHAAVAAALADQLVAEDALVRVGEGAALAPAALLRGTGLRSAERRGGNACVSTCCFRRWPYT